MTRQRTFKRLVRARMAKTGESYTAARAVLLAGRPDAMPSGEKPWLATSEERIRERTGRGWEEWFDLLDESGAPDMTHREIARWVADLLGIEPLAWNAQAITASYERTRRGRLVGEHEDGFTVTASRTVAAPPERVFDLLTDPAGRRGWLADAPMAERRSTRPRSARFDWDDDGSRVAVTLDAKDDGTRCLVSISHARLADATTADARKAWWRERLTALKTLVEEGGHDA
jgi:polyketide cyclase/dehydrase/lipid transport protein